MGFLFPLFCLLQVQPPDPDFGDILQRLEADPPATRESASKDLDACCRRLGTKAAGLLKTAVAQTEGEAKARLQAKLAELRRVETCRKSIESLQELHLPDLRDKPLVLYNTGHSWSCRGRVGYQYSVGWLLDQTASDLRILCPNADIQVCSRKSMAPVDWDPSQGTWPQNRPLPHESMVIPPEEAYGRVCGTISAADTGIYHSHPLRPAAAGSFHSALFIRWALERGDDPWAWDLLKASEAAVLGEETRQPRPYPAVLSELVCERLRYLAIVSQEPRAELIKQWRVIERREPNFRYGEPGRMIRAYEKQVSEEASWKEPSPPHGAECWIHRLRELGAAQPCRPGICRIFPENARPDPPYPPEELLKLGWEAIPALIDHLDDEGPTRSVGWQSSSNHGSYYLLRVGDCCRQIIEKITGITLTPERDPFDVWVPGGDVRTAKENAQQWWAENGPGGAERFFLASLDKPGMTAHAASKLLEMNAARHRSRLLEILEKGPRWAKNDVLAPLEPYLAKEDERLVEAVALDEEEEAIPLATAAGILWRRYHSDRGALAIASRLKELEADDAERYQRLPRVGFLCSMRTEKVAQALLELLGSKNDRVRYDTLSSVSTFPHPALAAALAAELGDPTPTGWTGRFEIRFCDAAAESLAEMTGAFGDFELSGSEEERDCMIAQLQYWWQASNAGLDWKRLVAKAEEAERPSPPSSK